MIESVEDLRGNSVSVGDRIAYAVRQGDTAAMRVGTVLEIVPPKPAPQYSHRSETPTKLRVQCEHDNNGNPPKNPTLIEVRVRRFVKVEA